MPSYVNLGAISSDDNSKWHACFSCWSLLSADIFCYLMMTEFCDYAVFMIGGDTSVLYEVSLRLQAGTGQMVRPWGAHTQTTHTHTDRAPAYTRSSTHKEAAINDSASLKHICMYVYFCVCFLVHHDWIIMPNGRTACWCITGSILFEQGHWMASCQGVMNVIYTCRLNKERKAHWDLDILTKQLK